MMRKLKPFHDFDHLTPEQLERIHASLAESSYENTRVLLRDEFKILISYGRLRRYHHRYLETQQLKERVGVNLTVSDYIKVQNGEDLPYGAVAHHLILKAACLMAASSDDSNASPARTTANPARTTASPARTITELLGLQRIANVDFQQKLAREKLALEQRRLALREQELALKRESAKSAQSTASASSDPGSNKPFRMWTEEEVRTNQPKIEAAFRAHPVLRYIGLPPVDVPPPFDEATPFDNPAPVAHNCEPASPVTDSEPPPQIESPAAHAAHAARTPQASKPAQAPPPATSLPALPPLPPLPTSPDAPFDVLHLRRVSARATPDHISRDLSLPLHYRVNFYHYARYLEARAAQEDNWIGPTPARGFQSQFRWCPCGQDTPCPDHGGFFSSFWEYNPEHSAYYDQLRTKNLPFTDTPAALAQQLREREWELKHNAESPPSNRQAA